MYKKLIAALLSASVLASGFCLTGFAQEAPAQDNTLVEQEAKNYPEVNLLQNRTDGVKIGWTRFDGAKAYRVFDGQAGENNKLFPVHEVAFITRDNKRYHMNAGIYSKKQRREMFDLIQGIHDSGVTVVMVSHSMDDVGRLCDRVFVLDGSWKSVGVTASDSLVCDKLKDGKEYTFTLRGLNSDSSFASAYKADGWKHTFNSPVTLSSADNSADGVALKWKTKASIEKYRIYRKAGNGSWAKLADVTSGSYTDKNVSSGTKYSYKLRGINSAATRFTAYYSNVKTVNYVKTPKISSFENNYIRIFLIVITDTCCNESICTAEER